MGEKKDGVKNDLRKNRNGVLFCNVCQLCRSIISLI